MHGEKLKLKLIFIYLLFIRSFARSFIRSVFNSFIHSIPKGVYIQVRILIVKSTIIVQFDAVYLEINKLQTSWKDSVVSHLVLLNSLIGEET